jgi:hypothetical protein
VGLEKCLKITSRRAIRKWTSFIRVARLRSFEMRANSFSHHEKTVNSPDVKRQSRRQVASGQSLVQVWPKLVAVTRRWLETLSARIITMPGRCGLPERQFNHMIGQSRTIRITVLNISTTSTLALRFHGLLKATNRTCIDYTDLESIF